MDTILLMLNQHQFAIVMAAVSAQYFVMPSGSKLEEELADTMREIARQVETQYPATKEK